MPATTSQEMTMDEDWKQAWQPLMDAVGQDFSDGAAIEGADVIAAASVRRYLEPLEFDCALHYDAEVAQAHGYSDVVVPCTAIGTFSLRPMWRPGETIFTSAERDAQPDSTTLTGIRTPLEPPTTGYFATDYEVEYLEPVVVGDRLSRKGARLVACVPKETSIGRGAFLTWDAEIVNQRQQTVARTRTSFYRYNPRGENL
jgi:acyl dehydratase